MINKKQERTITIVLVIFLILVSFPTVFSLLISIGDNDAITNGRYMPTSPTFESYKRVFDTIPLGNYLKNSTIASLVTTVSQIIIGVMAAYFFTFVDVKYKNFIYTIFMIAMMVPSEVIVVRNFKTIRDMNLLNTYLGLVLPNLSSSFGIFLLRQNMLRIPYELKEAADILGVSDFYFLRKVVIPMSKNSILTLGVTSFISSWNSYLWPLVSTTNEDVRTAQLGLRSLRSPDMLTDYSMIAAGAIIVAIPTILIVAVAQKNLQDGLSRGSIK